MQFSVSFKEGEKNYKTKINGVEIMSKTPLYHIVKDFQRYTHFRQIKSDNVVLDLGSNEGYLSSIFSKLVGDEGQTYSFEPDSKNIKKQESVFELNKIKNKVDIHETLIWNENTKVPFNEEGSVGSSAHYMGDGQHITEKEACTLDSWCENNQVSKIDFIKMDIEGAEIEAIEGAKEMINKYQPHFAIASYHVVNGQQTYIKLEEMFKKIDYPFITKRFGNSEIITFAGPGVK